MSVGSTTHKTPDGGVPPPGLLDGFAGTTAGSFFKAPRWVDQTIAAGRTNQDKVYGDWKGVLMNYLKLNFFFFSPNFTWFAIAAAVYFFCPYDYDAAKTSKETGDFRWVLYRLAINFFVVFAYFGFWNLSLYKWGWGTRKFNTTKNPKASRMFHNMWYSFLGVVQWTVWEACFVYAYATGRLEFVPDSEMFHDGTTKEFSMVNTLKTVAWTLFVPAYRDFHFYFAHRLLHYRVLYKHVHSLHHRNTDIEPFSGLCMHPIEHLFYYSCVGPSLVIHASPFIMMWNGIHLLISPAASHSGWEDHFQSDQFHYLHHAKFECNYGTSGPPMDQMFGTFREKLGRSLQFKGVSDEIKDIISKPNEFLSGHLSVGAALPVRADQLVYDVGVYAGLILFTLTAAGFGEALGIHWQYMAWWLCHGPVLWGFVTLIWFGDKKSYLWPFQKEKLLGAFGFHMLFAGVLVVLPVHIFGETVLRPDGEKANNAYFAVQRFYQAAMDTVVGWIGAGTDGTFASAEITMGQSAMNLTSA